jgi:hypothetical protein
MSNTFEVTLGDGRVADCWVAMSQPYENITLSSGLVKGIEPDNYFLRFEHGEDEPTIIFLREDEALAVIYTLSGALWSTSIFELEKDDE